MGEHLKKHLLIYITIPLLVLAIAGSYYRAMVSYDYIVEYEGFCDPYTESCFVYCEDDECADPFYYTWMTKKASVVVDQCGKGDINECDVAFECSEDEVACEKIYCEPGLDEDCEYLTESDTPTEEVVPETS